MVIPLFGNCRFGLPRSGKATDSDDFFDLRCLFADSCHGKATDSGNFLYFRCLWSFLPALKATDFAGFPRLRCLFAPAAQKASSAAIKNHCRACPPFFLYPHFYILPFLLMFVPADDARIQVNVNLLDLLVFFQAVYAEFTANVCTLRYGVTADMMYSGSPIVLQILATVKAPTSFCTRAARKKCFLCRTFSERWKFFPNGNCCVISRKVNQNNRS